MSKWHPVMYTDTPQVNPIIKTLRHIFTCCVSNHNKPINIHEYAITIEQIDKSTHENNELVGVVKVSEF